MLIMKKLRIHFAGFVLLLTIMVVGVIGFNKALDEQENDAFNVMTFEKNRLEGGDIAKAQETGQWSDSPVITGTGDVTGTPTNTMTFVRGDGFASGGVDMCWDTVNSVLTTSGNGWITSGGSGEPSGLHFKHHDRKGEPLYSYDLPSADPTDTSNGAMRVLTLDGSNLTWSIDTGQLIDMDTTTVNFTPGEGVLSITKVSECTCDCKQCKKCERK
jgi:hypothetical protein